MPTSTSETVIAEAPVNANVVSSSMVIDDGAVITGASFWSSTVTVTDAVPILFVPP